MHSNSVPQSQALKATSGPVQSQAVARSIEPDSAAPSDSVNDIFLLQQRKHARPDTIELLRELSPVTTQKEGRSGEVQAGIQQIGTEGLSIQSGSEPDHVRKVSSTAAGSCLTLCFICLSCHLHRFAGSMCTDAAICSVDCSSMPCKIGCAVPNNMPWHNDRSTGAEWNLVLKM